MNKKKKKHVILHFEYTKNANIKEHFTGKELKYIPWIEEYKAFLSDKEFIKIMLNTKKEE